MCIDVVEICFGNANGQISSIFDSYLPRIQGKMPLRQNSSLLKCTSKYLVNLSPIFETIPTTVVNNLHIQFMSFSAVEKSDSCLQMQNLFKLKLMIVVRMMPCIISVEWLTFTKHSGYKISHL